MRADFRVAFRLMLEVTKTRPPAQEMTDPARYVPLDAETACGEGELASERALLDTESRPRLLA